MNMPLFTVVVPTHDRPDLLADALESVRVQTFTDLECIVVEDAPAASTAALPQDGRFRLVRHDVNRGAAAARNTGLRHASGQYVVFLDDDDVYTPERLELCVPHLAEDVVVVCARGRLDGSPAHDRKLQGDVSHSILDGFVPHLGQTAILRSACPEFDERYAALEDVEWWLRLSQQLPVLSTDRVGYLMRSHGGIRHGNGAAARVQFCQVLLEEYAEYFRVHRRARAFRLERMARLEASLGRRDAARAAAWKSAMVLPRPRTVRLVLGQSWPAKRGFSGRRSSGRERAHQVTE